MEIKETEYLYIIEGEDYQGKFQLRVHKDLDQIQIHNSVDMDGNFPGDEVAININLSEIIEIRDFLSKIIDQKK